MRLLPESIAGRMIAVLLLGLTISHALSTAVYRIGLSSELSRSSDRQLADRITSIRTLIEETPQDEREHVAHAISRGNLDVHSGQISLARRAPQADEHLNSLKDRLIRLMPDVEGARVQIAYADDAKADWLSSLDRVLLISLQLPDSTWVNLSATPTGLRPSGFLDFLISTSLLATAVNIISVLSVRILTAPLRALARAADRIGTDVTSAPLPERGPSEVRQAAHAFNNMQSRIKKLITDRTQMLAAISHDLRTPITRLRLRGEFVDDDEQRRKMMTDLDEMEAMISSTLAFLREDASKEQTKLVDVAAILETVCDDMADSGLQVRFEGKMHAPLTCRPLALKRAFSNLIENAVRYGSEAVVSLSEKSSQLCVDIDDRGPGISAADRERVFAPFYRLESSRSRHTGGTGLGLTVARSVVRSHGGEISLTSRPEGGLRVTVLLPQVGVGAATAD